MLEGRRGERGQQWDQQAQYIDFRGATAVTFRLTQLLTLSSPRSVGPYFSNLPGQLLGTSMSVP